MIEMILMMMMVVVMMMTCMCVCVLIPMNIMTMMNCVVNVIAHAYCKQCHKHDCMVGGWMD